MKHAVKLKWKIAAIVLAVAVFALILIPGGGKGTEVETVTVSAGDIVEAIPSSGKIRPTVEIPVSPDVSGEIVELNFKEGDRISKGDTILKIRQDLYLSVVERAEAALGSVQAEYHRQEAGTGQALLNLRRCKALLKDKAVSDAEYEKAEAEYDIACQQLAAAACNVRSGEASLKEAMENLTKTVVISPMDGTVSKMNVSIGERVVGTSQMAGTEMLRIADFSRMEIVAEVGENDVVRIKEGDSAEIMVDAYQGLILNGLVTHVANSSKFVGAGLGQVANFEVRIAVIPGQDGLRGKGKIPLKRGMSATATILTGKRHNVPLIPVGSIFADDRTEKVWKVGADGTVSAITITTGIQDLNRTEITSGLQVGDTVVTGPYTAISGGLKDGEKVLVRN